MSKINEKLHDEIERGMRQAKQIDKAAAYLAVALWLAVTLAFILWLLWF